MRGAVPSHARNIGQLPKEGKGNSGFFPNSRARDPFLGRAYRVACEDGRVLRTDRRDVATRFAAETGGVLTINTGQAW